MPQMTQVLREHAIGMLTAGISTRAVAYELNVNFSTISHLQRRFREFGSTYNRPHNRRPCVTKQAQDLHIQHLHLQDHLRPATWTAAATVGLNNQRISAQTVRNRLREAHLHARHPHRGLDLTAVQYCGLSGPWWRWGYGMHRHLLWTTNTSTFYWWHFECTEIPWRDPEARCCAIHSRPSPYVAASQEDIYIYVCVCVCI